MVEAVNVVSLNVLTFQLVMGGVRFFVMGAYIPPADTTGVDDLHSAWDKCPANCHLLLLGDLNIYFGSPCRGELAPLCSVGAGGMDSRRDPRQLLWSIVVLIPKGGGDYRGIGLLGAHLDVHRADD